MNLFSIIVIEEVHLLKDMTILKPLINFFLSFYLVNHLNFLCFVIEDDLICHHLMIKFI